MTVLNFPRRRKPSPCLGMRPHLSALQSLLQELGGRQRTLLQEGLRLRDSVRRLHHLTRDLASTHRRLGVSLRRLRAVSRRLPAPPA